MKKLSVISIACFLFLCTSLAAAQKTPKAALEAFYKYDRSHSQTFNRNNIIARRQWFSAELHKLLLNELQRDANYLKKNPTDKPYFGDGLPFQPLQENCEQGLKRGLVIKQESHQGDRAVLTATFAYPKPCKNPDPAVYTIGMIRGYKSWVIDDINYGEDTTLKQRLRRKEY
jgi:hypothetical protein